MASLDDFLLYATYTGVKKGIEKLSKGRITSDYIDGRVEKKANSIKKDQDRIKRKLELEKKYRNK